MSWYVWLSFHDQVRRALIMKDYLWATLEGLARQSQSVPPGPQSWDIPIQTYRCPAPRTPRRRGEQSCNHLERSLYKTGKLHYKWRYIRMAPMHYNGFVLNFMSNMPPELPSLTGALWGEFAAVYARHATAPPRHCMTLWFWKLTMVTSLEDLVWHAF